MADGFLTCPVHGDVLWDQDASGVVGAVRILPAHPDVPVDFRPKWGEKTLCPLPGCGLPLIPSLRASVRRRAA